MIYSDQDMSWPIYYINSQRKSVTTYPISAFYNHFLLPFLYYHYKKWDDAWQVRPEGWGHDLLLVRYILTLRMSRTTIRRVKNREKMMTETTSRIFQNQSSPRNDELQGKGGLKGACLRGNITAINWSIDYVRLLLTKRTKTKPRMGASSQKKKPQASPVSFKSWQCQFNV